MTIRRASLHEAPVHQTAETAAAAGYNPARRLLADWADGENRFDAPGEVFVAAFEEARCVGFCGLNRDPFADEPALARVRRLYVVPDRRGRGSGTALVRAVLAEAGGFTAVRVRTDAAAFFEALGFRPIADPDATHILVPRGRALRLQRMSRSISFRSSGSRSSGPAAGRP